MTTCPTAECPSCQANVSLLIRPQGMARFANHSIAPGRRTPCALSMQFVFPSALDDNGFEARAVIAADLAEQVQDADPAVVKAYINCLPQSEKDIMLMIALAGMNCDGRLEDIFAWVCDLPAAKAAAI